jgi:hypothetical protein
MFQSSLFTLNYKQNLPDFTLGPFENCNTVTLLPLVILHLEPHHVTPESTERSTLNHHFLVRICY